jgi:hypothetical protein
MKSGFICPTANLFILSQALIKDGARGKLRQLFLKVYRYSTSTAEKSGSGGR